MLVSNYLRHKNLKSRGKNLIFRDFLRKQLNIDVTKVQRWILEKYCSILNLPIWSDSVADPPLAVHLSGLSVSASHIWTLSLHRAAAEPPSGFRLLWDKVKSHFEVWTLDLAACCRSEATSVLASCCCCLVGTNLLPCCCAAAARCFCTDFINSVLRSVWDAAISRLLYSLSVSGGGSLI